MSIQRVLTMVARDLRMGPRSAVFLFALVMPFLITVLLQLVLLSLFDPAPRLGIADAGRSAVTRELEALEGLAVTRVDGADELRQMVELHDLDAGLVLEAGFDQAVRERKRPELQVFLSGESHASSRLVLAVTLLDVVRKVEARAAPVEVALETVGEGEPLPITRLMTLFIVLFVLLITGIFVPAFMLVDEREHRTLEALLVTPTTMTEVLLSKLLLGLLMAVTMTALTLALNGALGTEPLGLLLTLAVAALMLVEMGLLFGTAAKDAKALYTLTKSLNLFLVGPMIFYFFPDWPQWIAQLFPTWWIIDPLYQISLNGASLADIWPNLLGALGICAVLTVPIVMLGRRLRTKLAAA